MELLRLLGLLIARDLKLAVGRPGQALLPATFFLLVGLLIPFAIGPEPLLLARLAPGIAWAATLLASLLPVQTLYAVDASDGTLDQMAVRGIAMETLALARMLALWLSFTLPLLLAFPLLAGSMNLAVADWPRLGLALALGGMGLAGLAGLAGALTLGARGGGGLAAILVLPLALPLLIFGSSVSDGGALRLLLAGTLLLAAMCPIATGAALRAAQS